MSRPDVPPQPAIGIDLGTTYSLLARLDAAGDPQTLPSAEGHRLTPSAVYFRPDGQVLVGQGALTALTHDADRVALCPKRDLGSRFFHQRLGGRRYPPETLEAWILHKLRRDAERSLGPIAQAVITVPAYFDEIRRQATMNAGTMAGLEVLDILNEPTAAALAYGHKAGLLAPAGGGPPRRILVFDLGGGTFDVTVMEIEGQNFTALATDGDVQLGGRDWDQRLVEFAAGAFARRHGVDPRFDPLAAARLWRVCEEVKRKLTTAPQAGLAYRWDDQSLVLEIARAQFEELTRDLVERTAFTTRQTLLAAGLDWHDLDRILLVGGASRMPAVVERLRSLSGQEPDDSLSPEEAVAHGAALHAGLLVARHVGLPPPFAIRNVSSHSLGVVATDAKTRQPRTAVVIPRNTPLPMTACRVFKTQKANQRSIGLQIVEGENASPDACVPLGKCTIRDLPPDLPMQTPIEVAFSYTENGRLTVSVDVYGTGKVLEQAIDRPNSLTSEQLASWQAYITGTPVELAAPAG
jgi:molecular chaperone DnaK